MKTSVHLRQHLAQFFLEWNIFQTNVEEKLKTYILCSVTFAKYRSVFEIEPDRPQMTI
jgi:fructose-bisphosphate aldolase class 1